MTDDDFFCIDVFSSWIVWLTYLTDTPLMASANVVRSSLNETVPTSSTSKIAIVLVTTMSMRSDGHLGKPSAPD